MGPPSDWSFSELLLEWLHPGTGPQLGASPSMELTQAGVGCTLQCLELRGVACVCYPKAREGTPQDLVRMARHWAHSPGCQIRFDSEEVPLPGDASGLLVPWGVVGSSLSACLLEEEDAAVGVGDGLEDVVTEVETVSRQGRPHLWVGWLVSNVILRCFLGILLALQS